jgi:inner membrane protein
MASVGHIALGMAAARAYRARTRLLPLALGMLFWSLLSLAPDLDVIGRSFGIRYAAAWGHRGATHSLLFCAALGALIGALAPRLGLPAWRTGACAALVLISHPLLDSLTDGGLGCALLWPLSHERFFAPWRPIPVSPLGGAYLSRIGFRVALAELVMFAPIFAYALWPRRK